MRSVAAGSMVLMSIKSWPGRPWARSPPGPSATASTSTELGSMVTRMSLASITSAAAPPALGAALGENSPRLGIYVMDEKMEALLAQIGSHGPPHPPQADEADSIHGRPLI